MPDAQTHPDPKDAPKTREATATPSTNGNIEARSFAKGDSAPHEAVGVARDLSAVAAHATREAAERGRDAASEAAGSWRGAFEPLLAMQLEMHRWFDDLWREAAGWSAFPAWRTARPFGAFGAAPVFGLPPSDMKETTDTYVLSAELPGLARDDLDIQVQGDRLHLSGQKGEEKDDVACAYRISERRFGRFDRSFPIPADVERNRIEASFRDGVLTVTLPKTRAAAQRGARIKIGA